MHLHCERLRLYCVRPCLEGLFLTKWFQLLENILYYSKETSLSPINEPGAGEF